jgi:hypothetical protein
MLWFTALLVVAAALGLHAAQSCLCCCSETCFQPRRARRWSVWLGALLAVVLGAVAGTCVHVDGVCSRPALEGHSCRMLRLSVVGLCDRQRSRWDLGPDAGTCLGQSEVALEVAGGLLSADELAQLVATSRELFCGGHAHGLEMLDGQNITARNESSAADNSWASDLADVDAGGMVDSSGGGGNQPIQPAGNSSTAMGLEMAALPWVCQPSAASWA